MLWTNTVLNQSLITGKDVNLHVPKMDFDTTLLTHPFMWLNIFVN